MNTFLKWILAAIGVVALLLVLTAVVLPLAVDPNDYKDEISQGVRAETGRDIVIGGEIKWTVFPSIGLSVSDIELSNRAGFGDLPMFVIGEAGASVKLMPLFNRRIEIGKVTLSDTSIYLRRKANGQSNWGDLGEPGATPPTTTSGDGGDFDTFVISELEINNASVTWHDADQTTELKGFGLTASNIVLGQPFDLEGGFSVNLEQSQVSGEAEFRGRIQTTADGTHYGIENLNFTFNGHRGTDQDATALDLAISADVDLDLTNDTAELSDFVLQFHNLSVNGDLTATALSGKPKFEGQLHLAEFSPKALLAEMGGNLPETASDEALTSLEADMRFTGTSSTANMRNLTVKFDQSTLQGKLKVDNFEYPRLAFDFQIDSLNLDDYLPTSESGIGDTASEDLTAADFRGFTGGGDFRIGTLVVSGLTATDISLKMNSNGKIVRLTPIKARFYGGNYLGDISINVVGKRPIMTTNQALSGIQAEGLLQDLTGSARLQGSGDFNLDIRTDLSNSKSIRRALTGKANMHFTDGAIMGINVAETIRTAQSTFGLDTAPELEASGGPKTDFSELSMSAVFNKGIMQSDDLNMQSPLLRVTGKGQVNLLEESVDFLVKPVLVASLEGQGGKGLDKLSGVPIPIRLSGNMYEPDISVDIMAAVTELQKEMIDQKKDELTNKVLGKLLGDNDEPDPEGADKKTAVEEDGASEDSDPTEALINDLFGGTQDKDKEEQTPEKSQDGTQKKKGKGKGKGKRKGNKKKSEDAQDKDQ